MYKRQADTYGTLMGEAGKKVEEWMDAQNRKPEEKQPLAGCMLWGVGNHGGGPSPMCIRDRPCLMTGNMESVWREIPWS